MSDGVPVERRDVCVLSAVRRLAATLGQDPDAWQEGDALPRGWHVCLFTIDTPSSALRPDGMAGVGVEIPGPVGPNVVMGGRRLEFTGDIRIGNAVLQTSRAGVPTIKEGRSGRFSIVTVVREVRAADRGEIVLREEQDYIFLEASAGSGRHDRAQPQAGPGYGKPTARRTIVPDEVLLFRYCAVTFNPHRIHFDWRYATEVEAFPGLVVNGGLTALLLTELFRDTAGREPIAISTRNRAPVICGSPLHLNVREEAACWHVWAETDDGVVAEGHVR